MDLLGISFLSLPLEIREEIYSYVISTKGFDHDGQGRPMEKCSQHKIDLLVVCRQIYREALPNFFRRPPAFNSQFELYKWLQTIINNKTADKLIHVRDLRIKLLDIEVSRDTSSRRIDQHRPPQFLTHALIPSTSTSHGLHHNLIQRDSAVPPAALNYTSELDNILHALLLMPNVRRLTIYKQLPSKDSTPCRELYRTFFPKIGSLFPLLEELTFFSNHIPLESFLGQVTGLRKLRFTGFSPSSPATTSEVLANLKSLDTLDLVGPPPGVSYPLGHSPLPPHPSPSSLSMTPNGGLLSSVWSLSEDLVRHDTHITLSVTPDVIANLRPLKRIAIHELHGSAPYHASVSSPPSFRSPASSAAETVAVFFTAPFLFALHRTHLSSLRSLKIQANIRPCADALEALHLLLSNPSALSNLALEWPGSSNIYLEHLPASLEEHRVAGEESPWKQSQT